MIPLAGKLKKALARDGIWTLDDVMAAINDRRAFPWFNKDSVVITDLIQGAGHHEANLWVAAGKLEDCFAMLPAIEDWGRGLGATHIRGAGRPGWIKYAARFGWGLHAVIGRKPLLVGDR